MSNSNRYLYFLAAGAVLAILVAWLVIGRVGVEPGPPPVTATLGTDRAETAKVLSVARTFVLKNSKLTAKQLTLFDLRWVDTSTGDRWATLWAKPKDTNLDQIRVILRKAPGDQWRGHELGVTVNQGALPPAAQELLWPKETTGSVPARAPKVTTPRVSAPTTP